MTRRERREARAARLREWAGKRRSKAEALVRRNEPYRGDVAFNTQPGHIPERARAIRREEKAFEHEMKARDMAGRAAGIEAALDREIYDDDPDAVERLEERIAEREALRARKKAINAAWKKGGREAILAAGFSPAAAEAAVEVMSQGYSWIKSPCDLTSLNAKIRRDRARLEEIRARREA